MTDARATQVSLEEFATTSAPAQVTQVTVEQWVTTATITGQALVTQVALEQWVPAITVSNVDLAGNLGGVSQYGKLKYGLGHYSRIDAFAPIFSADLDVHVHLIDLVGDMAPQIALGGPLTVLSGDWTLSGSFGFSVVLAASGLVSGPLWAASDPCPPPLWADSELCPPPAWMITPPCDPVAWNKSGACNG